MHGRSTEWAHPRPPAYPQTKGCQIGDHRLSKLCGVVERPDHHCDDDLVRFSIRHRHVKFELYISYSVEIIRLLSTLPIFNYLRRMQNGDQSHADLTTNGPPRGNNSQSTDADFLVIASNFVYCDCPLLRCWLQRRTATATKDIDVLVEWMQNAFWQAFSTLIFWAAFFSALSVGRHIITHIIAENVIYILTDEGERKHTDNNRRNKRCQTEDKNKASMQHRRCPTSSDGK